MENSEPQFCEDHGHCICGNDCMDPHNLTFDEHVSLFNLYKGAGVQENEYPTPDQLVAVMKFATTRQLRHMAVNFLRNAENATQCIQSGHHRAIEFARNHICENTDAAYQRGADDFAKAMQEGLIQLKEQDKKK